MSFEAYIDKEDILPGEAWQDRLSHLISSADSVVFLVSPDSVRSTICDWEVNESERLGKRILPVVISNANAGEIPRRLSRLNYIYMRDEAEEAAGLALLNKALLTDIDWIRRHTEYAEQALRWARATSKAGFLLRSPALEEAEHWIASRPQSAMPPTPATQAFIEESRRAATRRRNLLTGSLAAGVLIALALAGVALWQRGVAVVNEQLAIEQTKIANERLVEANAQRRRAEDALAVSQEKESLFLARAAREELSAGNALTSVQLALRGLPVESERPFVPEAFGALVESFNEQRAVRIFTSVPEGEDVAHYAAFVQKVSFSHSGGLFVATSHDSTVRVWDAGSGKEVAVLRGHDAPAEWAMFSPDDTKVLTSSFDKTTRLWEVQTGNQIGVLQHAYVRAAAFSPNGSRILALDEGGTLRLWEVASGGSLAIWQGAASAVTSRDGKRMLTLSADPKDRAARLWDVATGKLLTTVQPDSPIKLVSFHPQGTEMAAALEDGSIRLWSTRTGEEIGKLEGYRELLGSIAYSPDGSTIATVSEAFEIALWDAPRQRKLPVSLGRGAGPIYSVAFSPDSSLVLVASSGDRVRLLERDTGFERLSLDVYELAAAQFAPDGNDVLSVSNDQTIALWDITHAEKAVHFKGHQGVVNDAVFSPDGSKVLSASKDGTARLWDTATGRTLWTLKVETGAIGTAAFSSDGKRVLTTSGDGKVRLWNAGDGRVILALDMGARWGISAELSSDGKRILTTSADSPRLWDAATGDLIADLERRDYRFGRKASFSPDATMILTTSDMGEACLWDGATGRRLDLCLPGHAGERQAYATFSPDSRNLLVPSGNLLERIDVRSGNTIARLDVGDRPRLVTFSKDGTRILVITNRAAAQVWELETGTRAALLQGHDELIAQAAFSPTGDTVLTASYDRTVRLWEAATGRQLAILRGRRGTIGKIVAYAPQGQRILVLAEDNIISSLWIGATPEQVTHRAHERLPAMMTLDQERKFYIATSGRAT